jgi:outer membrane lipoprotein-sorting protein
MYFVMKMLHSKTLLLLASAAAPFLCSTGTAEESVALSAADLAKKLSSLHQDGDSYVRVRLDAGPAGTLQLEGKQRHGRGGSEVVYRVLFPKERKGEALLLRADGGARFVPPNTLQKLGSAQMDEPFFGSALANADLVEDFFAWPQQALVGTETVDRVNCQVLESKPPKGGSIYGSVKSWIDLRRMVPLKVEKYSASGKLTRKIETTRVVADDRHRQIPANLSITGPNGTSDLDGSKIKHGVTFADAEFTVEGLKQEPR